MITGNEGAEPLDGYRVIAPSGRLVGEVAGVSETAIVVQIRRLGRTLYRPLPREFALVWQHNRTVVAQISPRELRGAPSVWAHQPVDEARVAAFYRARPPLG